MLFGPDEDFNYYVLGFLNTRISRDILEVINPTLNTSVGEVGKLPLVVDKSIIKDVVSLVKNSIKISKEDWNSAELSLYFDKLKILGGRSIEESLKDLQHSLSNDFFTLFENERKLNEIFIKIYGLDGLTSADIDPSSITLFENIIDHEQLKDHRTDSERLLPIHKRTLIFQLVSYSIGLIAGRYCLSKSGLHIAHPDPTNEELASYQYNGHQMRIDEDAIIPLYGEDSPFADNVVRRFKDVLVAVWGEETLMEYINFLNECLGMSYEKFLTEKFWDYHKKVYQKKPIYWLFSSAGGSFRVLVYMHRMDKFTVQKIRLNYLHKYIEYLTNQLEKLKANGATNRTADKLEKALQDCREYDKILKPLADQQISFDLDDGVTVNHAKFKPAVAPIK